MVNTRILGSHRTWEDWFGFCIGILIFASPWIVGETANSAAVLNAAVVGVLVMVFAALELVDLRRFEEYAESLFGLWLIASPYIFGYAAEGALGYLHFALGAIVVALAVLELWQDWNRSEKQLSRHGW